MQTITSEKIMEFAKAFRKERNSVKQADISAKLYEISPESMGVFFDCVAKLANPDDSIKPYETKAGKISGVLINAQGLSHRGQYLNFDVVRNWDKVDALVRGFIADPPCKY